MPELPEVLEGGISKNKLGCELRLENKLWTGCHSKVEENICNGYGRKKKNLWDTLKNGLLKDWSNKSGKKKNVLGVEWQSKTLGLFERQEEVIGGKNLNKT